MDEAGVEDDQEGEGSEEDEEKIEDVLVEDVEDGVVTEVGVDVDGDVLVGVVLEAVLEEPRDVVEDDEHSQADHLGETERGLL